MPISRRGPVAVFRAVRRHPVVSAVSLAAAVVVLIGVGVVGGVAVAGGLPSASAAGTATPTPSGPAVDTAGFPTGIGIFTDTCTRTHTTADDPILMPGMTGQSMQHDFFGNRAVTASSTASELVGGGTSCSTSADASAYWTPVLFQNGSALAPQSTLIYWRAPMQTSSSVQAMPAGITLIAGNERATAPQGTHVVAWTCSGDVGRSTASPHDCPSGHELRLVITFPDCWDGHTLDGQHQTNVVYPSSPTAACPSSHPVQIPQIVFHANYPTSSAAGLTLSIGPTQAGSIDTEHADFMDGWTQSVMAADVRACTAADVRCGPVTGPEATPKGGKAQPEKKSGTASRKAAPHRSPAPSASAAPMAGMS